MIFAFVYRESTDSLILTGAGLLVQGSPAANNTYIVYTNNRYSTYEIYCYSNSTSSSVGYFRFPNNQLRYSGSLYTHYVSRQSPSGIKMYNNQRSYGYPSLFGIFTCQLPDAEGNTVETSLGIYSSTPSKQLKT